MFTLLHRDNQSQWQVNAKGRDFHKEYQNGSRQKSLLQILIFLALFSNSINTFLIKTVYFDVCSYSHVYFYKNVASIGFILINNLKSPLL